MPWARELVSHTKNHMRYAGGTIGDLAVDLPIAVNGKPFVACAGDATVRGRSTRVRLGSGRRGVIRAHGRRLGTHRIREDLRKARYEEPEDGRRFAVGQLACGTGRSSGISRVELRPDSCGQSAK